MRTNRLRRLASPKLAATLLSAALSTILLTGCHGMPEKVTPVKDFKLERYLGQWHEIARYPNRFEENLINVSANYSLRDDGGVKVLNRGTDKISQENKQAEGKAYFVEESDTGYLKVSFFGPFYGSYVVFELDPNYQYAFVAGNDETYLWLLSRTPTISESLKQHFIDTAKAKGFDVDKLEWVEQRVKSEE